MSLLYIEWDEVEEPEQTIRISGTDDAISQLENIKGGRAADPTISNKKKARKNSMFLEHQEDDGVYGVTVGEEIRKKFVAHVTPINPHLDIQPTYQMEMTTQFQPCFDSKGEWVGDKMVMALHDTTGRCIQSLEPKTAARLKSSFHYMALHHPTVHQRVKSPDNYLEALQKLTIRYSKGTCTIGQHSETTADKNQYTLPSDLYWLLCSDGPGGFKCTKQRFASPLDSYPDIQQYWSIHKEDQAFGASHDAYSVRWTGSSVAVPNIDPYAAEKALEWAIKSAATTTRPTLTVQFVPKYGSSSSPAAFTNTAAQHAHLCKHLVTIPASRLELEPPANRPYAPGLKLSRNMLLLAVGNASGFSEYCPYWDHEWRRQFIIEMEVVCPKLADKPNLKFSDFILGGGDRCPLPQQARDSEINSDQQWITRGLPRFRKLPEDCTRGAKVPGVQTRLGEPNMTHAGYKELCELLEIAADEWQPAHSPANFIYTDGSAVPEDDKTDGPGTGAAVCILPDEATARTQTTIPVFCHLPGPEQNANTINRAELAAIAVAIEHTLAHGAPSEGSVNIATDSLSSICQIKRTIERPQDMKTHRHYSLLRHIADLIRRSSQPIHLWKVKSHNRVLGNELADKIAVSVARGTCIQKATVFSQSSNNRFNSFWPCREVTTQAADTDPSMPGSDPDSLKPIQCTHPLRM